MVLQQNREFRQSAVEVALLRVFHCQSIARKGVFRILGEHFIQRRNTIHWSRGSLATRVLQIRIESAPSTYVTGQNFPKLITMASPRNKDSRTSIGLSLFHAARKARERQLALSRPPSAGLRMERALYCPRP